MFSELTTMVIPGPPRQFEKSRSTVFAVPPAAALRQIHGSTFDVQLFCFPQNPLRYAPQAVHPPSLGEKCELKAIHNSVSQKKRTGATC